MIDHVSIAVRNLAAAGDFYERLLTPLGYARLVARIQPQLGVLLPEPDAARADTLHCAPRARRPCAPSTRRRWQVAVRAMESRARARPR